MAKPKTVQEILLRSYQIASDKYHELVTLEHVLAALLESENIQEIIDQTQGDVEALIKNILQFLNNNRNHVIVRGLDTYNPRHTPLVANVIKKAKAQCMFNGRQDPYDYDILLALYDINESHASYFLDEFGPDREDLLDFLSQATTQNSESSDIKTSQSILEQYCINLNQKAKLGKIDPLIGRETEVENISQILSRRKKNNVIMVGSPGVGKTVIVEGLAKRIIENQVPDCLKDKTIYSLDISGMLAGTKFRGDFEERMKQLITALIDNPKAILFIDEIHMIMGAGNAGSSGGAIDAANMLKPVLGRGEIMCIGSTTHEEYKKHFEKDRALVRRFQQLDINEPSIEDSKKILKGVAKFYSQFHNVAYTEAAINAAVELSAKHIHDKCLPDKAVDIIDSAGAWQKIKNSGDRISIIDREQIEQEVARVAKIPSVTIAKNDTELLASLEPTIKNTIYGQDQAVTEFIDAVYTSRSGLREQEKTLGSFLFTGPSGVGKSELARQMSQVLGIELIRFDMSEYQEKHSVAKLIGSPPGYIGYGDGLAGSGILISKLQQNPHCVLLFDEIEKAHPDVSNIFLQLMDYGMLTSSDGKTVSARHAYVIYTTNLGAKELEKNIMGFGSSSLNEDRSREEVTKFFTPEFRNRLDAIIQFNKLTKQNMHLVLDKFIKQLNELSSKKLVNIQFSQESKEWLIKRGFDAAMGARPMSRIIQKYIKQPLSREILFGKLKEGGTVTIDVVEDALEFTYGTKLVKNNQKKEYSK